jgi:hypothetical protein
VYKPKHKHCNSVVYGPFKRSGEAPLIKSYEEDARAEDRELTKHIPVLHDGGDEDSLTTAARPAGGVFFRDYDDEDEPEEKAS